MKRENKIIIIMIINLRRKKTKEKLERKWEAKIKTKKKRRIIVANQTHQKQQPEIGFCLFLSNPSHPFSYLSSVGNVFRFRSLNPNYLKFQSFSSLKIM